MAFVLKGYPRLSETFIAQEILALERRGLDIVIYSLRHPTDTARHPSHRQIRAPLRYLPEYLYQEPWRVLRALWRQSRRPGFGRALAGWWRDLRRDRTANRVRRFGQALVLADELAPGIDWLHAHFLHTPSSVARYASLLTGLPWSCSAHAKDIWTIPAWEKREKLASARWVVTCTAHGWRHLTALMAAEPDRARIDLVYHGLDTALFPEPARRESRASPLVILSVGRAVEKKGYDCLLQALAQLPATPAWRFVHIGGGPLLEQLRRLAKRLGIAERIEWLGPRAQEEVLEAYRSADVFVLASRIAKDGDRDGLPNVLMEAQSQAVPTVASNVTAIPELIADGRSGLLVRPDDPQALAAALSRLLASPALRSRLGRAGARRTRRDFAMERGIDALAERFGLAVTTSTTDKPGQVEPTACASPSMPR